MSRLKSRMFLGTALLVLALLGLGGWFYSSYFRSTNAAIRHAVG